MDVRDYYYTVKEQRGFTAQHCGGRIQGVRVSDEAMSTFRSEFLKECIKHYYRDIVQEIEPFPLEISLTLER